MLSLGAANLYQVWGAVSFLPFTVAGLLFTVVFFVSVERALDRLQMVAPSGCSIYARAFWRHERAWKVPSETYFTLFDGTPFKAVLWRLLGVRIGRRVFDDGCFLTERTFTAIGDNCTLNAGSVIQCHSQEDGAFKSDRTVLGAGCTLGVGAFVHYGVSMGDGAVLAPDSFLMKGEEIAPHGNWGGNPAIEIFDSIGDLRDVLVVDADLRPAARVSRLADTDRTERPDLARRPGRRLARVAASTALASLIVLALSGGVAMVAGVPMPSRAAVAAPMLPAVATDGPVTDDDATDDATDEAPDDSSERRRPDPDGHDRLVAHPIPFRRCDAPSHVVRCSADVDRGAQAGIDCRDDVAGDHDVAADHLAGTDQDHEPRDRGRRTDDEIDHVDQHTVRQLARLTHGGEGLDGNACEGRPGVLAGRTGRRWVHRDPAMDSGPAAGGRRVHDGGSGGRSRGIARAGRRTGRDVVGRARGRSWRRCRASGTW